MVNLHLYVIINYLLGIIKFVFQLLLLRKYTKYYNIGCRFQDTMVAVIGQRKAEVSLTTGKMYTTDEALEIGLVDESVPDANIAIERGKQFLNNFQRISRK